MLLEAADVVVQDDTGIPYRFISQSPWHVKLYGRYHKPIRPMKYGYQKDLDAAYNLRQDQVPLPFPFGYRWRGQQSGRPATKVKVFRQAGHALFVDEPGRFNASIEKFVKSLPQ